MSGIVTCSRCKRLWMQEHMAHKGLRNGKPRYASYCNECRRAADRARREGKDIPWPQKIRKIKDRADKRGIECTLTADTMQELWIIQGGHCVYTETPLLRKHHLGNNPQSVSVDRIDPSGGYTADNILLCSFRANSIKQDMTEEEFKLWMPLWYSRLQQFLIRRDNARNPADVKS